MGQPSATSTSSSLIRQVKENEPRAWEQLCALYAPMVFNWCRAAGLQSADASDIVQRVFTAVYRHLDRFRRSSPDDSFRSWLWKITRNAVGMHVRQANKQPQAVGGTDALKQVVGYFRPESRPEAESEQLELLDRALQLLEPQFEAKTWQAFWRTAVDGEPGPQVAEDLQMSPGAVRQAKYAVLQRLRALLTND